MSAREWYHAHTLPGAVVLTACVPLLRLILHRTVFKPFGTYALAETELQRKTTILPPKLDHRRKKLTESLWKVTAYGVLMSMGIYALHNKQWAANSAQWWKGYPNHPLEWGVEAYYIGELAFYGASTAMLLFWEERRHDFPVMLTHHVVTICLIAFSYSTRYFRIGSVVMLLHDPSDVFLEAAKLSQYLGHETTATIFFVLLLVTWFVARLVVLPFWLVRSALYELPVVLGHHPPYSLLLAGMLCMLVCMHIYWFALLARIAVATAVTGHAKDVREDED